MPRAEIPAGVERWHPQKVIKAYVAPFDPAMERRSKGSFVLISDLPKLHQHWLEQLKGELREPVHTLASTIGRARVLAEGRPGLEQELADAADALKQLRAVLASIHIEGGGDGD